MVPSWYNLLDRLAANYLFCEEPIMMTLRRVWLAALVLAMSALLGSSALRAADPKLFPKDTEVVLTFNLKQILDSELVKAQKDAVNQAKAMFENLAGDNPASKYLKDAGFDLFRDLHSITVAGPGKKDFKSGLIVIEGKFNVEKINAAAADAAKDNAAALKITKSGSQTIYEITPPNEKQVYATFFNDSTLIAAPTKDILNGALGRANGSVKKSALKKEFATLLETTNKKQSLSFAATGPALAKMLENAPNGEVAAQLIQNIDGLAGALTIAKDIQFQLAVNASDEATAKDLAQKGRAALGLLQTLVSVKAKEDEKLLPVVDIVKTLRITNQGSNLVFRGEASLEAIEKLIKNFPGQ